jgi:hypothetical protein
MATQGPLGYVRCMRRSADTLAVHASSGSSATWMMTLTPNGHLVLQETAGGGQSPPTLPPSLAEAFARGSGHGRGLAVAKPREQNRKVLKGADLASVFGLEMADGVEAGRPAPEAPRPGRKGAGPKRKAEAAFKLPIKAKSSAKASGARRASRAKPRVAGGKTMSSRSPA